ncbi:lipoprotein [Peribacillus loiseleuriae]|uniref:Lipoprotein n=1 Tax=Peribacillus loiseleuriae TaxID=1679170 RepID=A0A0K9GRK8_9BACI|nr:hypothetical protein [Peribacillus loiseleuriae]KMY49236.1 hypothetical protein AC625_06625 [Peribacillus loiseleuriae]
MKKSLFSLLFIIILAGCSSSVDGNKSKMSMETFVQAFEQEGFEIDVDKKPMYSLIGAKDGIIFENDNRPVKIYEFDSEDSIKKAKEALPAAKDWDRNGLFLLETKDEKSKETFNKVK